jgi:hypothetical protein
MATFHSFQHEDTPNTWLVDDDRHLCSRQNHYLKPGLGTVKAGTLLKLNADEAAIQAYPAYDRVQVEPWAATDAPDLIIGVLYDTLTAHATASINAAVVIKDFAYREPPLGVTDEGGLAWPAGITPAAKKAAKDHLKNVLDGIPVAAH